MKFAMIFPFIVAFIVSIGSNAYASYCYLRHRDLMAVPGRVA